MLAVAFAEGQLAEMCAGPSTCPGSLVLPKATCWDVLGEMPAAIPFNTPLLP